MIVVGGERDSIDLNDFWALDLDKKVWYQPQIDG
jgi:hypothetical protein